MCRVTVYEVAWFSKRVNIWTITTIKQGRKIGSRIHKQRVFCREKDCATDVQLNDVFVFQNGGGTLPVSRRHRGYFFTCSQLGSLETRTPA